MVLATRRWPAGGLRARGGVMEDYHEERPDRGCLLGLALACFFWAGALLLLAYLWGWF